MLKTLRIALVGLVLASSFTAPAPVQACPMCQVANEDDTNAAAMARPRAYMYSILFMLAMPATIFTGFGVSLYRLTKKRTELNEEMFGSGGAEEIPFNE